MSERTLSGSVALTKLTHVIMDKKGKDGQMVKCIVIPIEANGLETKDKAVYLGIRATVKDETDQYGQNGFISKTVKRDKKWSEMSDTEKEAEKALTPILGNLKDFAISGNNDAAGAAAPGVVAEDDDLPF
ncbi:hypothetical protein DBR40_05485 [Pedobacter sp. KBW01]|uniref:hypothetical protein n=1 Tax=Pedobacter sp. KBW01 TaxID=2153364 RepID=UPI000F59A105|nr:hypothetical protein [Pedobacter sp. KBW01]RQO79172.1 hypothetical protein DBR40_05485 [Pedobacter sp. KBW01]